MKNINPAVWRIPQLHIPLEYLVVWRDGFNEKEIDDIIALGELAEFQKGAVGGKTINEPRIDADIRDTDIAWITPDQKSEWLYEKMKMFIARVNYDKYQFDLDDMQALQYGKYQPNGHYKWHIDSGPNLSVHRKLTFIVALSSVDSYEGGELLLNIGGDPENAHSMKIEKGDIVVFPSFVPHKVVPVTAGERITLVTWATGPKFV
jgi:PKHD-type hydroxylase